MDSNIILPSLKRGDTGTLTLSSGGAVDIKITAAHAKAILGPPFGGIGETKRRLPVGRYEEYSASFEGEITDKDTELSAEITVGGQKYSIGITKLDKKNNTIDFGRTVQGLK